MPKEYHEQLNVHRATISSCVNFYNNKIIKNLTFNRSLKWLLLVLSLKILLYWGKLEKAIKIIIQVCRLSASQITLMGDNLEFIDFKTHNIWNSSVTLFLILQWGNICVIIMSWAHSLFPPLLMLANVTEIWLIFPPYGKKTFKGENWHYFKSSSRVYEGFQVGKVE